MKKISLTLSIILALGVLTSCAKESKSIPDTGPNFSIDSTEVRLKIKEASLTPIKRDDHTSGPQIQVLPGNTQGVVAVERKLICGPVVLQGRKVTAPDWKMFNFRLAEEEFPGLFRMPLRAQCKLTVIATNNVGSTNTLNIPVTLAFDKPAPISLIRNVATPVLIETDQRNEVPLESYTIMNKFDYSIGVIFTPKREVTAYPHYIYFPELMPTKPFADGYRQELLKLKASRIEVVGLVNQQQGDLVHELRFILPPQVTVTITSYGQVPVDDTARACFPNSWGASGMTSGHCRRFTGVHIAEAQDAKPTRSLALWRSFEVAPDDISNPSYLEFKEDIPFPGVTADKSLMGKFMRD